jgi:heme-degrading monooxygenase HmoA
VRFAKLLGTGSGRTFRMRDADLRRWALVTCWSSRDAATRWESSAVPCRWRAVADETWRVELRPLSSRGTWSGTEPFGHPATTRPEDTEAPENTEASDGAAGRIAALTRARLRARTARAFWRAVPPVSAELREQTGLCFAVGIGEAPVGLQGTFSLWESAAALRRFAYSSPRHIQAIADTTSVGWYGEELFARFAVLASSGSVDGIDPAA